MSRARAIITFASGRRAKWGVVVFWLIIVALAGPLSGKLTGLKQYYQPGLRATSYTYEGQARRTDRT